LNQTLKTGIFVLLAAVLAFGLGWYLKSPSSAMQKTGYVNVGQLMVDFEGRKEATAKLDQKYARERAFLDSLGMELQTMESKMNTGEAVAEEALKKYQSSRDLYENLAQKVGAVYEEERDKEMKAVTEQLDAYMMEFGKNHGYDYVFGAGGGGEIMFARADLDVTKEAIEFVNKRYKGEKL
jgi:outer membrane protein